MQKPWFKNYIAAGIAVVTIVVAMPFIVNAEKGRSPSEVQPTNNQTTETVPDQKVEVSKPERLGAPEIEKQAGTDRQTAIKTRLSEVKLGVCQKREKTIDNIIARMGDRGTRQLDIFTKIADRTEAFYAKSGKVLTDYDSLVNEVNASKADVLAVMPTTTVSFKCDGSDPKGMATSFKASRTAENTALKALKTAVRNLIVGVKSVQSTETKTEGSN